MRMKPDRSIHAVLAKNVRRLRELRGWTHDLLAKRLGIGVPTVVAIERGRLPQVRIGIVEALARELEVDVVELLTRKTPKRKAGGDHRPPKAKTRTADRASRRGGS
jgi:transcriptional regulator with XRE-family HTH domain